MSLTACYFDTINKTDKYDLGYISEFYDELFTPIKDTVKKVFEIGIFEGESAILWNDFFQNADIYCADIIERSDFSSYPRIRPSYENAYSKHFIANLEKESFDIVIDDGPHTYDSMAFFLTHYIDLVKSGGYLILEDIIDRDWTIKLLNLLDDRAEVVKVYDMRNKQKTDHLTEMWKNGLDVIVIKKR